VTTRALVFDFDGLICDTGLLVSLADARSSVGRTLALPRPTSVSPIQP
jgi:hypothetical protein